MAKNDGRRMTEEEKMVEEMARASLYEPINCREVEIWNLAMRSAKITAKHMLGAVHRHVHLVAKVCPECATKSLVAKAFCNTCHGHGVVAKEAE